MNNPKCVRAMVTGLLLFVAAISKAEEGGVFNGPIRASTPAEAMTTIRQVVGSLTETQASNIEKIVLKAFKEWEKLHQDESLTPADRSRKGAALRQGAIVRIRTELTEEQQRKFNAALVVNQKR